MRFKHDANYNFPRGEDIKDLVFLVKSVLVIIAALIGFVAVIYHGWV